MAQLANVLSVVELGTGTHTPWLIGGLVGMVFLKWFLRYISFDRLDALLMDMEDLVADHDKKGLLPSFNQFKEECNTLERRISLHKRARYTIDEACWRNYITFFMWNWWRGPLGIRWAAGKLRRRVMAEAEIERSALERALENHRVSRRRILPV